MARNPGGGEASDRGNNFNSASSPRSQNHDLGEGGEPKKEEGADDAGGEQAVAGKNVGESAEIGTVNYPNGNVYEGELKDGKKHGRGVLRYPNGDVYDCEWKDNEPHGTGVFKSKCGVTYEGDFKEGFMHGKGKLSTAGNVYDGQWRKNEKHGAGKQCWKDGDTYDGEWKENRKHGKGIFTWADGIYEGGFKDGKPHGKGTCTWRDGDIYEGQWAEEKKHGQGTMKYSSGDIYEGDWKDNSCHGTGTKTWANGTVYEGCFVDGTVCGWGAMKWPSGNVYEGEWKNEKQHGRGTVKWKNGDVYEGEWEGGQKTRGKMTWAGGETWTGRFFHHGNAADTLDPPCEPPIARKLRSQRSQQRLQKNTRAKKTCEHCRVDDGRYKLRACSGCNLALYCSAACQKAASGSHRRICNIVSELPPRDSDRLALEFDKDKMVDLDAGLRYGAKYMDNLKHLAINLEEMGTNDKVKLSAKQLSSLLRSNRGALDSVFWLSNDYIHVPGIGPDDTAWKELHGLKQLGLEFMRFDDVQPLCDNISQQRNTLMVLSLPYLGIEWHKAKCRRTLAQAISSCKHLVKLDLQGCVLMDSDVKIMLHDLPDLRILGLRRHRHENSHQFSDNTCGLIARKCPGLQEINLQFHNHLSVRGIRKIFEGCSHLRAFFTTMRKLSCGDIRELLDIAPQLLFLSVADKTHISEVELSKIVEATGGRTVLEISNDGSSVFESDGVTAKTKERYDSQIDAIRNNVWSRRNDPEVANGWAGMF